MYTDIPEWTDYLRWWGTAVLAVIGLAGIVGGLLYLFSLFS
jgi:hypothetical protein